ncbi:MAG: NAD(P)-dependent oxidoreductase [Vicingaceae bacterium]|nr:NAD(P)-dependent oxidoreductase [Vicingaceae bacterium]
MIKVLFIWDVNKKLQEHLKKNLNEYNLELVFPKEVNENFYLKEAPNTEVIVGWRPSEDLLKNAKRLKLFINPGAGIQHLVEHKELLNNCIIVNGHGNSFYTAEHIVAMLLSLSNQIIPHHKWMKEGKWRLGDKEAKSFSLRNRKIGLLGYGHVNHEVHNLLKPFNCEFYILKRNPSKGQYGPNHLTTFLKQIDVLINTLPLTEKTENLITYKELKAIGVNGVVINAGRGKTFNEKDLYNALKNKTISSAAIDVWYDYDAEEDENKNKYPYQFPFYNLDNILFSPHRAASPFDDLNRWDDVIYNLKCIANNQPDLKNIVDLCEGY